MVLSSTSYLARLNAELGELAMLNLGEAIKSKGYTGPELLAMKTFEELRLIGGLDLASVLLKGERLKSIRELNMSEYLPGKYNSMEEAIQVEAKISRTEQSWITSLYEHVFPYVEKELNISVQEFWEDVPKSNAAEIVPHLRMIITDQPSRSENVRSKVKALLVNGNTEEDKRRAVQELISISAGTNNDVRKELRPDGTPTIPLAVIRRNGTRFILAEVTEDQLTMLNRAFGRHLDIYYHDEDLSTLSTYKRLSEGTR